MEATKKPENLSVLRKKGLTVVIATLWLILGIALEGLFAAAYFLNSDGGSGVYILICFIGSTVFSAVMFTYSALYFRNLAYPVILASDEKGLYDYSGFLHCGFIPWEDIAKISGPNNLEAVFNTALEGYSPAVIIELKDNSEVIKRHGKLWRVAFYLTGFGCIKIRTFFSPLSRKQTDAAICERFLYYADDRNGTN